MSKIAVLKTVKVFTFGCSFFLQISKGWRMLIRDSSCGSMSESCLFVHGSFKNGIVLQVMDVVFVLCKRYRCC